jgi:HSP20 family protein
MSLDPINDFFNRPFGREGGRLAAPPRRRVAAGSRAFPPVNVFRDRNGYVIRTEVPGIPLEELSLEATGQHLTISAKRAPHTADAGSTHRLERWSGDFSRAIQLPQDADAERIEASYRNGVLSIRVPQHEASKPKTIEINH